MSGSGEAAAVPEEDVKLYTIHVGSGRTDRLKVLLTSVDIEQVSQFDEAET